MRVPLPQIAGIWDRLLAVTGDPHFALHAAEHVDLTTCDVITYLEANAKTLREALSKKFEYLPLITDAIIWTLDEGGGEAVLTLHEQPPRPPLAPVAEFLLASRHLFCRRVGPRDFSLRFVSFRHPAPSDTSEHVRIFGTMPRFDSAHDSLGFASRLLDEPMRQRDEALADLLERYAVQAIRSVPSSQTASERVRELLRSGIDPGIEEVARRLGCSARSLQRALRNEGTSYAKISIEMRRALAERLLARGELAIAEVAFALGFSDVPAFHKAFLRWTGSTPGEYRTRTLRHDHVEPVFGRLQSVIARQRDSAGRAETDR